MDDDTTKIQACIIVFDVLHEAVLSGGYSAGRIVERLRQSGFAGLTVSHLHGHGLQDVANAIAEAGSTPTLAELMGH